MKKKSIIICLILLFLFILDMVLVVMGKTNDIDISIYKFIMNIRSDFFDKFFMFITNFGNAKTVILIVLLFIIIKRNKDGLILGTLAFLSSGFMTLIKPIVRRDRPNILRLITESNYSFPSGHAMISIAIYGYFIYYFYCHINNKFLKYLVCSLLSILVLLIGISRVYLGVHYPSDILGGYLLSSIILIIVINVFENRKVDC